MKNFINKEKILQKMKNEIFPDVSFTGLMTKILFLHLVATLVVLTICPQFGFGLIRTGHFGLTRAFMSVSQDFCMFACGAFLTTISGFIIWSNLKYTEKEFLLKHKVAFNSVLLILTSSFFWMFSPEIILLDFCIWLAGTLTISIGTTELIEEKLS